MIYHPWSIDKSFTSKIPTSKQENLSSKRPEPTSSSLLIFSVRIRPDLVNFVHTKIAKNKRQGHAVNFHAHISRVVRSGTLRNGRGAFRNICSKGIMFASFRIWRRWHRRNNLKQKDTPLLLPLWSQPSSL